MERKADTTHAFDDDEAACIPFFRGGEVPVTTAASCKDNGKADAQAEMLKVPSCVKPSDLESLIACQRASDKDNESIVEQEDIAEQSASRQEESSINKGDAQEIVENGTSEQEGRHLESSIDDQEIAENSASEGEETNVEFLVDEDGQEIVEDGAGDYEYEESNVSSALDDLDMVQSNAVAESNLEVAATDQISEDVDSRVFVIRSDDYDRYETKVEQKVVEQVGEKVEEKSDENRMVVKKGAPVILHIYDVSTNPEVEHLNRFLTAVGTGAFHGAVEVYGKEWSFGWIKEGTGVFNNLPKKCTFHHYRESLELGETHLTMPEVRRLLSELEPQWLGKDYDLIRRNCVTFCSLFARRLGVQDLPRWVTNLALAGATIQDGAMQAATTAQQAAIVAAAKAGDINAKYDITGKTVAHVGDMLVLAKVLEERYRIKDVAAEVAVRGGELALKGAMSTLLTAKDLDRRYAIQDRTCDAFVKGGTLCVDVAVQAAATAKDIDDKYALKEKAGYAAVGCGELAVTAVNATRQMVFLVSELAEKHKVKDKLTGLKEVADNKLLEFDERHLIIETIHASGCAQCATTQCGFSQCFVQ